MSAAPLLTCTKEVCAKKKWGRGKVKKQIGAGAGLLFKGSGFYITDYRSAGYHKSAKSESAPAKAAGGDAKPAPAPAPAPTKPAAKADKK